MANYLISYPRSGNTMARYIFELITRKPTNGICGPVNTRDKLQSPLIYKDSKAFVLHKRHDFRGVGRNDFVIFILRDFIEATIRHNEQPRGVDLVKMMGYIDSWFALLNDYDLFQGNKMLFYYDELLKIADKKSLQIYPDPQSKGPDHHKQKLSKHDIKVLHKHAEDNWYELYHRYL